MHLLQDHQTTYLKQNPMVHLAECQQPPVALTTAMPRGKRLLDQRATVCSLLGLNFQNVVNVSLPIRPGCDVLVFPQCFSHILSLEKCERQSGKT